MVVACSQGLSRISIGRPKLAATAHCDGVICWTRTLSSVAGDKTIGYAHALAGNVLGRVATAFFG
jgi:hypothetical protein